MIIMLYLHLLKVFTFDKTFIVAKSVQLILQDVFV